MSGEVRIERVRTRGARDVFLRLPWKFYRGNAAWVPPLLFDVRSQLDPSRGDFFKHSAGEFFLAYRGGEPVGRIAALKLVSLVQQAMPAPLTRWRFRSTTATCTRASFEMPVAMPPIPMCSRADTRTVATPAMTSK